MTGLPIGAASIAGLEDETNFFGGKLTDRLANGEAPIVINFLEFAARPLSAVIDLLGEPTAGGAIAAGPSEIDNPFAEIGGIGPSDSFLFADSEWRGRPDDVFRSNQIANARLIKGGEFQTRAPISPFDVRRSQTTVASATLVDTDGFFGRLAKNYALGDMRATQFIGEEADKSDNHELVVNLIIKNVERDGEEARINFKAADTLLDRPAQTLRFTGDGGEGGDPQLKDRFKPLSFGYCYNVALTPVEADLNIFLSHGAGEIGGYDDIFDRRAPLAWDGRHFKTYTEFKLAAINAPATPGFYMLGPRSYVQIGQVNENSLITADLRGSVLYGDYDASTRAIWRWFVAGATGLGGALVDEGTFGVIPHDEIGIHLDGSQSYTIQNIGNSLLAPHLCWNDVDKFGRIAIARLVDPAGAAPLDVFDADDIFDWRARPLDQDVWSFFELTYGRNWRKMSPSEIIDPASPQINQQTYERIQRVEETGDGYGDSKLKLRYPQANPSPQLRGYFRYQHHMRSAAQHIFNVFSKPLYELEIDVPYERAVNARRGFPYGIDHPDINEGRKENMSLFKVDPSSSDGFTTLGGIFAGLA
ncbi:MAG: hypothetical protein AAGB02_03170 [Pseudomonadota bacterium]